MGSKGVEVVITLTCGQTFKVAESLHLWEELTETEQAFYTLQSNKDHFWLLTDFTTSLGSWIPWSSRTSRTTSSHSSTTSSYMHGRITAFLHPMHGEKPLGLCFDPRWLCQHTQWFIPLEAHFITMHRPYPCAPPDSLTQAAVGPDLDLSQENSKEFKKIPEKFWKFPVHLLWWYPGPYLACSCPGPPFQ